MKAAMAPHGIAVEQLVADHQAPLRGFLRYLGCPLAQVDDLVQDVFLSVLRAGFEDRGGPSTAAYLRRVAKNRLLKLMRSERTRPPSQELDEAERAWMDLSEEGSTYLDALRDCLGGVEGRAETVLHLRYKEDLSRAAIAGKLGMTESGVNSILVRVRKRLRNCVENRVS